MSEQTETKTCNEEVEMKENEGIIELEQVEIDASSNNYVTIVSQLSEENRTQKCLMDLDDDTSILLISYLNMQDMIKLSETCKRFYKLTSNNILWEGFLREKGYDPATNFRSVQFKQKNEVSLKEIIYGLKDMITFKPLYSDMSKVPESIMNEIENQDEILKMRNIKQIYVAYKKNTILEKHYSNMKSNAVSNYKREEDEFKYYIQFWVLYGLLVLFTLIYFGITMPLILEKIIPNSKYSWLIPYLPTSFALCIPYLLLTASTMWKLRYFPVFTRRHLDQILQVMVFYNYSSIGEVDCSIYWINGPIIIQSILLYIPVLILMIGLKLGLYNLAPNFLWVYVVIPVIIVKWLLFFNALLFAVSEWHGKVYYVGMAFSSVAYALFTAGMLLTALKADAILPSKFLYSYTFLFYYGSIILFLIGSIGVMLYDSEDSWFWMLYNFIPVFIVANILLSPVYVFLILVGLKLDNLSKISYFAVFSPVYGFATVAVVILLLLGFCYFILFFNEIFEDCYDT